MPTGTGDAHRAEWSNHRGGASAASMNVGAGPTTIATDDTAFARVGLLAGPRWPEESSHVLKDGALCNRRKAETEESGPNESKDTTAVTEPETHPHGVPVLSLVVLACAEAKTR